MTDKAKDDLQILANTTDRALYIRIKVQHPQWSDELVKKEIESLRSAEFAEYYRDLFHNVLKSQNERTRSK